MPVSISTANTDQQKPVNKITIIPLPKSREEYEKVKLKYEPTLNEANRETFERRCKGIWTREVLEITRFKTVNGRELLNWSEMRHGKTSMGLPISELVTSVPQYRVPIPSQELKFDEENEENVLVQGEREQEVNTEYSISFSTAAIDELLDDASKNKCRCYVSYEGKRVYDTSLSEMDEYGDKTFEEFYNSKATDAFKIVESKRKRR